jgi:hypothetical protein
LIDALQHGSSNGSLTRKLYFWFSTKEQKILKGRTAFTVPEAKTNPVEGVKTTLDVLMQKYDVNDPTVSQIGVSIRDYELMRRLPKNFNLEQR